MRTFYDWKAHQSKDKVDILFHGKHEGRMTVQTLPTLWQRTAGAASPISVESGDSSVVCTGESTDLVKAAPGSPDLAALSSAKEIPLRCKEQQVLSVQLTTALTALEGPAGDKLLPHQRQTLVGLLVTGQFDLLDPCLPSDELQRIRNAVVKAQALLQD